MKVIELDLHSKLLFFGNLRSEEGQQIFDVLILGGKLPYINQISKKLK